MAGSSTGKIFKVTTFGESHGPAIGAVIDGCPAGLEIDIAFIRKALQRRRPGQSKLSTSRKESEEIEFLSGIFEGKSSGTPIAFIIRNEDQRSKDYSHIKDTYRPSHADFTYDQKYGFRDYRGGGRASARETAARVAAGGIATLLLRQYGIEILAYTSAIGPFELKEVVKNSDLKAIDSNLVRCPDKDMAEKMEHHILVQKQAGDSCGGVITCLIKGYPAGLGEPVFDKLHADLGKAILSIPACKGIEFGAGFQATKMKGSEMIDPFTTDKDGKVVTSSNNSGGIQGGISNGMDIFLRAAFKPVSTLMRDIPTIDTGGNPIILKGKGRHDPCVVPRAIPIVEAMAALVLADHLLRRKVSKL